MFKKIKIICMSMILTVLLCVGATATVKAANIDATLAVSPKFNAATYALLNPQTALESNYDITQMYNSYMSNGVKNGQRIYATPLPTTNEYLFKYMAYNRASYIKNGLNANFAYFNLANYMTLNPDLIPVYGTNYALYVYHYVNFGIYEGRPSGAIFDPARAIVFNPALASLNNASLDPNKIYNNYVATTGLTTTAMIGVVNDATGNLAVKTVAPTPAPAPVVNNGSGDCNYCGHHYEYMNRGDYHIKRCTKCGYVNQESGHNYVVTDTHYGANFLEHKMHCEQCGAEKGETHWDGRGDGRCDKCGVACGPRTLPPEECDPPQGHSEDEESFYDYLMNNVFN